MPLVRGVAALMLLVGLALSAGPSIARADSAGLVAAYGFEETGGTSAADSSGRGNAGTVAGPASSALGRFGRALSFDGVDDLVNVADSASLDLTTGLTLEAWVKPAGVDWQTILLKERPGGLAYALYSSTDTGTPSGEVRTSSSLETRGSNSLPFATWSHLATTYDGSTLRLYVNGNQVSSRAVSGPVEVGAGTLRIGGNLIWGEYFRGLIDEVRVYQRALNAAEIQADMQTPVISSGTDTQPPTTPGGLTAALNGDDVQLSWSASSDDTGVTGYRVHRSATNGFTPDAGNLVATSPAAAHLDADRPTGTWYYRVIAVDAAGNASGPSPQASATIGVDSQPPTAPGNLTATVLSGDDVRLSWNPSTGGTADVTSYRIYRDDSLIATRDAASPREHDDVNAPVGSHRYKVLAVDATGTAGPPSAEAPIEIVPDTTPPTATLGGASCGTVNGYVPLRPTVSDDRGAVTVRVEVDGAIVFGPVTAFAGGPYTDLTTWWTFFWEIGATPPGLHVMTVHARDSAANEDVSEPCVWRVGVLSVPITSPADGATVSGTVLVDTLPLLDDQPAAATGNVSGVHFKVDGADAKFASGPAYQYSWDTTTVANGVHTLKADLYWLDYGAPRASSTIQVTVNNSVPQPTGLIASVTQDDVHLAWSPAPAGSGVTGYRVHRSSTAGFTPTDANRIATPATTLYDDLNRPVGTWYYRVVAVAGANPSQPSAEVSTTIVAPPAPSGLVAAYGFDEASGTAVTDSSGTGNAGTISGATRSTSGRYGGALSFDGLNDVVSIADSNSLDLTTGMTLEAWVRPVAVTNWRTVLFKERPGGLAYGLYAGTDTGRPGGFLDIGGERSARGTAALPLNTWTHVAATYDGANLRFFVNGTQTGVLASSGAIPGTTGQLKIGGNSVWSEWFRGLIDEVRVYDRALTAVEIQADRDRPVTP